jgi:hypothetical protein
LFLELLFLLITQSIPAYDFLLGVEVPRRLSVDAQLQKLITDFETAVRRISDEDRQQRALFEEKYLKYLPQRIIPGIKVNVSRRFCFVCLFCFGFLFYVFILWFC